MKRDKRLFWYSLLQQVRKWKWFYIFTAITLKPLLWIWTKNRYDAFSRSFQKVAPIFFTFRICRFKNFNFLLSKQCLSSHLFNLDPKCQSIKRTSCSEASNFSKGRLQKKTSRKWLTVAIFRKWQCGIMD